MENVLKKQSETLKEIEKDSKQDKLIQAASLLLTKNSLDEEKAINEDGDRLEQSLKQLNEVSENSRKQLVDIYKKILEQNSLIKSMAMLLEPKKDDAIAAEGGTAAEDSTKSFLSAEEKEFKLEETSLLQEQNSLLRQIAENTAGLAGMGGGAPAPAKEQEGGGVSNWIKGKLAAAGAAVGAAAGGAVKKVGRFAVARPALAAGLTVGATTALGGYLAYKRAGKEEAATNKEIDAKVARGEVSEEQAQQLKQESSDTARVGRNEAVGKGVVGTGGALLGAKGGAIAGAKLGSFLGPKGIVVGGLIGAGVGAVAGSKVGKDIGGFVGRTAGKVSNFTRSLFRSEPDSKEAESGNKEDASKPAVNKVIGPNYAAYLKDNTSDPTQTPVAHLEKQYPGIGKKFVELAKKNAPRSDSQMSIQNHENALKLMAMKAIKESQEKGTSPTAANAPSNELGTSLGTGGGGTSGKELLESPSAKGIGAGATAPANPLGTGGGKMAGATSEASTKKPELAAGDTLLSRESKNNFRQVNPEAFGKYQDELNDLTEKYAEEAHKKAGSPKLTKATSPFFTGPARKRAIQEVDKKYRKEAESADAAVKADPGLIKPDPGMNAGPGIDSGGATSSFKPPQAPAKSDSTAVEKKSSEADTAKTSAMKPSSGGNTIVAPSTTVNNNQSKVSIKAPIRNQESSQSQYIRNRYVS